MQTELLPIVVVGLLLCLGVLAIFFLSKKTYQHPYQKRFGILTNAEKEYFFIIKELIGNRYLIFPQLSIDRIIWINSTKEQFWHYKKQVDRKTVDFVLVDPQTTEPKLIIELDDRSHDKPDRIRRDKFVDSVFAGAGIPILHQRVYRHFDKSKVGYNLHEALRGVN